MEKKYYPRKSITHPGIYPQENIILVLEKLQFYSPLLEDWS